MNTRRHVLVMLGAAAIVPRVSLAQSKQPVLIGWLNTDSRGSGGHYLAAFKEGLAALGWKEGSQFVIEERWADGGHARLQPLAEELAALKPAVIVAAPSTAVRPMVKAAPNTAVVQATGASPVDMGLAASLARPGGMLTGVTNIITDVSEKHLELLLAALPKLRRVGFLLDSRGLNRAAYLEIARRSATRHSVEARFAEVAGLEEIEPALSRLAQEGAQALVVFASPTFLFGRLRIVKLALERSWPVVASTREWAEDGALVTYGVEQAANYRRAAYYVDRILEGRQARRSTDRAADQIRTGGEHEDGQGARHPNSQLDSGAGDQGDRIIAVE